MRSLVGNGTVIAKGPQNVIRAVLGGLPASESYASMPAVGAHLTDQQVADVVNYVRQAWSNKAPPTAGAGMVGNLRKETRTMLAGDDCTKVTLPALAHALDDPASGVGTLIKSTTASNMITNIDAIAAKAKAIAPGASRAELVNSLTAAYCPMVAAGGAADPAQKAGQLDQFGNLVYTALRNGGIK